MKYKLLKDTPAHKAGLICQTGLKHGSNSHLLYPVDSCDRICKAEDITDEWFAPYVFTTLDNKDIFVGDTFYFIDNSNKFYLSGTATIHCGVRNSSKVFSTKQAAQNYIDKLNKPKFEKGEWLYMKLDEKIECIGRYNYTKEGSHWFSEEYSLRHNDVNTNQFFIQGIQETSWCTKHNVVKADTETIQRILSKVALHKGFKEGVQYKSATQGTGIFTSGSNFKWEFGDTLYSADSEGNLFTGCIYYRGVWAEIVEIPEYVKCVKSVSNTYLLNKVYKVQQDEYMKGFVIGEGGSKITLHNHILLYPSTPSSIFTESNKAEYDAQFQTKELTITLDGDVVNTSHWGNSVKITYK